jgi:protease II
VGWLDTVAKELTTLDVPYSEMSRGDIKVADNKVVFEAGSSTEPMSLLQLDLDTGKIEVLRRSSSVGLDLGHLSES